MAREKRSFGESLIESTRQATMIHRGEMEPGRVTKYTAAGAEVSSPPPYGADRIRKIRGSMGLSQPVFAAALNVSPETIRAWEQGKREPDGATLRLLEIAEQHPGVFFEKVRPRPAPRRSKTRTG